MALTKGEKIIAADIVGDDFLKKTGGESEEPFNFDVNDYRGPYSDYGRSKLIMDPEAIVISNFKSEFEGDDYYTTGIGLEKENIKLSVTSDVESDDNLNNKIEIYKNQIHLEVDELVNGDYHQYAELMLRPQGVELSNNFGEEGEGGVVRMNSSATEIESNQSFYGGDVSTCNSLHLGNECYIRNEKYIGDGATEVGELKISGKALTFNGKDLLAGGGGSTEEYFRTKYVYGNQTDSDSGGTVYDRLNIIGGRNTTNSNKTGIKLESNGQLHSYTRGGFRLESDSAAIKVTDYGRITLDSSRSPIDGSRRWGRIELFSGDEILMEASKDIAMVTSNNIYISTKGNERVHIGSSGPFHGDYTSDVVIGSPGRETHLIGWIDGDEDDTIIDLQCKSFKFDCSYGEKGEIKFPNRAYINLHECGPFMRTAGNTDTHMGQYWNGFKEYGILMGGLDNPMGFFSKYFTSFVIAPGRHTEGEIFDIISNNVFGGTRNPSDYASVTCSGYITIPDGGPRGVRGITGDNDSDAFEIQYFSSMHGNTDDASISKLYITKESSQMCNYGFVIYAARYPGNLDKIKDFYKER